ncbi:MAG: hypothetical protein WDO18_02375 [Acidobacteriota bacterium]
MSLCMILILVVFSFSTIFHHTAYTLLNTGGRVRLPMGSRNPPHAGTNAGEDAGAILGESHTGESGRPTVHFHFRCLDDSNHGDMPRKFSKGNDSNSARTGNGSWRS